MKYAKVINGIVDHVIFKKKEGYIECPISICGGASYVDEVFTNPVPEVAEPSKEEKLNTLIVTVNNKNFYADPDSRVDIMTTIMVAESQGSTDTAETNWKTPDGIISVTLLELRQANQKAIEAKAGIIGVV